ncbi:uncharacterized protein LTR77_007296 [Saxophila tyrrhenica]|uniref:Uncharacterized protein n=1 Tax=Saxophila tyrrhenica TaxID=1690608 RepID=A0AAV9P839_9PEZI|nr:hypothetical protein LTR77_007296 [Saxophila tyrrhenica]
MSYGGKGKKPVRDTDNNRSRGPRNEPDDRGDDGRRRSEPYYPHGYYANVTPPAPRPQAPVPRYRILGIPDDGRINPRGDRRHPEPTYPSPRSRVQSGRDTYAPDPAVDRTALTKADVLRAVGYSVDCTEVLESRLNDLTQPSLMAQRTISNSIAESKELVAWVTAQRAGILLLQSDLTHEELEARPRTMGFFAAFSNSIARNMTTRARPTLVLKWCCSAYDCPAETLLRQLIGQALSHYLMEGRMVDVPLPERADGAFNWKELMTIFEDLVTTLLKFAQVVVVLDSAHVYDDPDAERTTYRDIVETLAQLAWENRAGQALTILITSLTPFWLPHSGDSITERIAISRQDYAQLRANAEATLQQAAENERNGQRQRRERR